MSLSRSAINNSSQTAAQASVEPTMVPSSAGTSATSIMPRLNPITIDESTILRQLSNITSNMKLRDNMLYQTASPTLLNFYDHFSSVAFLANSTPPNRDDVPIAKHISDFITQHEASTVDIINNTGNRVVHLPHRGGALTLPTAPTADDEAIRSCWSQFLASTSLQMSLGSNLVKVLLRRRCQLRKKGFPSPTLLPPGPYIFSQVLQANKLLLGARKGT